MWTSFCNHLLSNRLKTTFHYVMLLGFLFFLGGCNSTGDKKNQDIRPPGPSVVLRKILCTPDTTTTQGSSPGTAQPAGTSLEVNAFSPIVNPVSSSLILPPQLEPLSFKSFVNPVTDEALICLTADAHTILQTNHIRLVSYAQELKTYNKYLVDCIERFNNAADRDSGKPFN